MAGLQVIIQQPIRRAPMSVSRSKSVHHREVTKSNGIIKSSTREKLSMTRLHVTVSCLGRAAAIYDQDGSGARRENV